MSQYGHAVADEIDDIGCTQLLLSYMRRKRLEARLVAMELAQIFGRTMGRPPAAPAAPQRTTADALLGQMGITL